MPPSSSPKSATPSPSGSKSSSHYILIALSLIIVAGFIVMYFKMDLLSKNLNTVAQQAEQKTPPPAPAPQATQPPVVQTPSSSSTITEVYTDPTTGLIFAVQNKLGPENYTFKKESIAGTELVSKVSVKRTADGNIPECASWFTISSVGGPTDPDAVLVTSKYMVSAPAADCEVMVLEKSGLKTFTSGNFELSYPAELTPVIKSSNIGKTAVDFTDTNNKSAFRLTCPIPETGFEAWNFTNQKRTFSKDGKTYSVTFMLGTPIAGSEDLGNFYIILMNSGTDVTSKDSCMLTSDMDKTTSLYQSIYESIN